jgi:hypothetical protein
MRFCTRCTRQYGLTTPEQRPNWAWRQLLDGTWEEWNAYAQVRLPELKPRT